MRSRLFGMLVGLPLLAACGGDSAEAGVSAEVLERGAAVYEANCAACHGAKGEGHPGWKSPGPLGLYPAPPHDSTGHTWHHADAALLDIIRRGGQAVYGSATFTSAMPAYGGLLSDAEVEAVLAYLKTFWGDEERAYQAGLSAGP